MRQKLKQEYVGLPGAEIKSLKLSGVEVRLHDFCKFSYVNLCNVLIYGES